MQAKYINILIGAGIILLSGGMVYAQKSKEELPLIPMDDSTIMETNNQIDTTDDSAMNDDNGFVVETAVTQQAVTQTNTNTKKYDDDDDEWEHEDDDDDDEWEHGTSQSNTTTQTTPTTTSQPTTSNDTTTQPSGITISTVASHNSSSSCWSAINGSVYDLTSWIPQHPGGQQNILILCGVDGSSSFNGQHGRSSKVASILAGFKIGTLAQ